MVEVTTTHDYIPSTIERKRAISDLFFVGIMMTLAVKRDLSVFEQYYLHVSLALRSLWLIMFLVAILVFFLVTLIGYLYVLVLLFRFGLRWFLVWQAREGIYNHNFVIIRFLAGFWGWLVSLFTIDTAEIEPSSMSENGDTVSQK